MNEGKPHYSFHLLGIMICLGLLAFTINRFYYPKHEGAGEPRNRPAKQGMQPDTLGIQ